MLPLYRIAEGHVREERRITSERNSQNPAGRRADDFGKRGQAPVFYGHAQMVNFLKRCDYRWQQKKRVMRLLGEDIVLSEERIPDSGRECSGTPHLSVGCVRND
ncbi:hypothetical protein ACNKHL_14365 [Shigella flexneri]